MDDDASFGHWLQRRRKALRLSCVELARRVGCATVTLRKIEADERRPSEQIAAKLAEHLYLAPLERTTFIKAARGELGVHWLAPAAQVGDRPALGPRAPVRANVPISSTPLIGRVADVAAVRELLLHSDARLLTLTGAPGIGKTRLALRAVAELHDAFADGVVFVSLAPIRDPELVLATIARALELTELPGQPVLERLQTYLRDRQTLLVLDNFEQVLKAAPQLAELLAAAPRLTLLITSRVALHLSGEQRFVVSPLALPDVQQLSAGALLATTLAHYAAIELFAARARALAPGFALTVANATAVATICTRLDGLPLAIELAAARVAVFTPQEVLARLDQRFALLIGGAVDLPTRQQTLRRAIDWSYELLGAREQVLFRRLGAFVDGCTLDAIRAACDTADSLEVDVLEGVTALLDKSLLQRTDDADGRSRFRMLETIREYALEKLAEAGELKRVQEHHLAYYLMFVEAAEPQIFTSDQLVWLDRLDQEHGNLRSALAWAVDHDAAGALRLGAALTDFWHLRGYLSEGRQWLERVLTIADTPIAARIKALHGAGMLAHSQEDDIHAEALYTESLLLAQAHGDQRRIAILLNDLGEMALHRDDTQRAMTLHLQALVLARSLGDQHTIAQLLSGLGIVLHKVGQLEAAMAHLEESLAIHQRLDDQRGIAWSLHGLGLVAQGSGAYSRAAELFTQALELARAVDDHENMTWMLYALACVMLHERDLAGATTRFGESARLAHGLGLRQGLALNLDGLATVRIQQRAPLQAARLLSVANVQWKHATSSYGVAAVRAEHERAILAARAQLDEAAFAAAWAEGRAMTLEQAIASALEG